MRKFLVIYISSIAVLVSLVVGIWAVTVFFEWLGGYGVLTTLVVGALLFLAVTSAITAVMPDDFRPRGPKRNASWRSSRNA